MENFSHNLDILFSKDDLEKIIEILSYNIQIDDKENYNELILLKGRFAKLSKDIDILSYEDYKIERRRFAISLKAYFEGAKENIILIQDFDTEINKQQNSLTTKNLEKKGKEPMLDIEFWFIYVKTYKKAVIVVIMLIIIVIVALIYRIISF